MFPHTYIFAYMSIYIHTWWGDRRTPRIYYTPAVQYHVPIVLAQAYLQEIGILPSFDHILLSSISLAHIFFIALSRPTLLHASLNTTAPTSAENPTLLITQTCLNGQASESIYKQVSSRNHTRFVYLSFLRNLLLLRRRWRRWRRWRQQPINHTQPVCRQPW